MLTRYPEFRRRLIPELKPYALLEMGTDMVVQYQGARARRALGTRAAAPGHVVKVTTPRY